MLKISIHPQFLVVFYSLMLLALGACKSKKPLPEDTDLLPSVSIVVPTYPPRHVFHELLYQSFLAQKYPASKLELVIFDNGDQPSIFFTSEQRERVRYHYIPGPITLGAKRNWLVENAKHEIIVSFDDDDFYGENYVATMVNQLNAQSTNQLVKLKGWPMASVGPEGKGLQFNFVFPDYTQYGWGFSWIYRKSIFSESSCRFADKNYAEEDPFAICIENHFGTDSIKRITASDKPYIALKFENKARYLGDNSPLKWSQFHVDKNISVSKDDFEAKDWRTIEKYLRLFNQQAKTNLAGFNRVPVPEGCEAGPCSSELLKEAYKKEQNSKSAQDANKLIPSKEAHSIRIATYNVHNWKDVDGQETLSSILDLVENFGADVVAMQEVTLDTTAKAALNMFNSKNALHEAFCEADLWPGAPFGNLLLSKYPLNNKKDIQLIKNNEGRCAIISDITTPLGDINITTTHLDVFDRTGSVRLKQINTLGPELNKIWESGIYSAQILMGDMNALKKNEIGEVWLKRIIAANKARGVTTTFKEIPLLESYGLVDSFEHMNSAPPALTTWAGRRVDYIFLRKNSSLIARGCYVYHSSASDHLAILCDFVKS